MDPIKSGASVYSSQAMKAKSATPAAPQAQNDVPAKASTDKVTLSDEGKALLAALKEIDHESKKAAEEDKTVSDKVESFTYGALGMEHPDKLEEENDSSYSAGQYLSAAATVGSLLLLI
ncbi:hypothetical protein VA7868_03863 [Vibrio aerogenes CECT 7868]|uniref:Uncharacterized protein n=1 Tax=Vibrio aerogenes CECT 7868 TaxID=1216006 RepID=A0A1M6BTE8_9VIBR|nr:hypothetical protein [Vibrio aerogenes]SHI52000.1 hypothetical protein VA7868_03863 [Vibrio aerogenes CECT 7868]